MKNTTSGDNAAPAAATDAPNPADDPALAELLDFEPVVRKIRRPDGWSPELQREFIARLALTGSARKACLAMEKSPNGVEKLYAAPGCDSFRAAWDAALAFAAARERSDRIARQGEERRPPHRRGGAAETEGASGDGGGGGWVGEESWGEEEEDDGLELRHSLLNLLIAKFIDKVRQERRARMDGNVPAADHYLRQITCLEVGLDLMAEGCGMRGLEALTAARRGEHGVLEIAETEMSRLLDGARRIAWEQMDEPPRPEHPPRRYLEELTGISIEPLQAFGPASRPPPGIKAEDWSKLSHAAQHLAVTELRDMEVAQQIAFERESAEWKAAGAQRHANFHERREANAAGVPSGSEDTSDGEHPHAGHAPSMSGPDAGFTPAKPSSSRSRRSPRIRTII